VVNEEALRVSAPNPNLKPEYSDNLSARLAYYFEPVGIVAANFYQNTVDGLFITSELSAEEYGYTGDEDYSSYIFTTTTSGSRRTVVRGMELEYSQSLSFLPGVLKGLNARASYTRNYAEVILPLLTGHSFKAGLSYAWRGLSVYGSLNWHDNFPTNATGTTYRRHRTVIDAGGGYRISDRVNLFFSLRNVFDAPLLNMQKSGTNPAVVTGFQAMGTGITLGVRGTF
jgi:outer membrane receptor protein involved in Fe transport